MDTLTIKHAERLATTLAGANIYVPISANKRGSGAAVTPASTNTVTVNNRR